MVILRTRNKITDFLMILAWASPFKLQDLQMFSLKLNKYEYEKLWVAVAEHNFMWVEI